MSSLISIIIPIYNTQEYLSRCLESVVNQTYKNLEIILINDGSTDNSLSICQKYKSKDSRIVLLSQQNSGQALARNNALDITKGDYVAFIDSDDWISLDYIEILYRNIKSYDADISLVSFLKCSEKCQLSNSQEHIKIYEHLDIVKAYLKGTLFSIACSSLISSELLLDLKFKEGIVFEDVDLFYKLYNISNRVVKSSLIKYFYFSHQNSSSWGVSEKINKYQLDCFKYVYVKRHNYLLKQYPQLAKEIFQAILKPLLGTYARNSHNNTLESKELLFIYKKYYGLARDKGLKLELPYKIFFYFPRCGSFVYLLLKRAKKRYAKN